MWRRRFALSGQFVRIGRHTAFKRQRGQNPAVIGVPQVPQVAEVGVIMPIIT
jgi:hypothetical protein